MATVVQVAAASRPKLGETVNGDEWAVTYNDHGCRIVVIDGLGHGPLAAEAANRARSIFLEAADRSMLDIMQACHIALRGGRGAVVSIVSVTPEKVSFMGVGNVEGRLWDGLRQQRLVAARGIVGSTLPTLHIEEYALGETWALVLFTDGISDRFDIAAVVAQATDAQSSATAILGGYARDTDDATVIVAFGEPDLGAD
jgi:hypothetical protein